MNSFLKLPTPSNINYMWNFGSLLGLCLFLQILTGFFLTMFYKADLNFSFFMVVHIMNNVSSGWLIRFLHASGASMFFIMCFIHLGKGMMNNSYYFWKVWFSGTILLIFLMMEAFLGYVLPWGQMSFWGATVITNLISVIPYFGPLIVEWLWGGFNVGEPTIMRFFSFHFLIPFLIVVMVMLHLMFLHESGSSNPLGVTLNIDKVSFKKFFVIKDLLTVIFFLLILVFISLKCPFFFMDPENFILANPMSTPIHIQPEWYFLFAYTILRSVPNKLGGVVLLLMSILILFILPILQKEKIKSMKFNYFKKNLFFFHIGTFILLTWLGMKSVELPFTLLSKVYSILYFMFYILY
uniref:Cytochrome b n=1 Tax=Liposcelis sculptilimacula TaxID=1899352 RepID=A0A191ZS63_9NEOP|nr:cytochrome b [Liposcelis keleri]ANJ70939.1 cytochrome b [Liposcelis sculptilimacula]